ncbi:unnamed protein product [Rotaria sordida]|uniref:Poly [ADP-ribose] polymerase n=1 Tax=Rotaria sordida TaxID=392033 RepID=A0A814RPS7_9BILA|nr:unnamed protein product [Rotaria sordida]
MSEQCDGFYPNLFKPNICRNCRRHEQYHQNSASPNGHMSSAVQIPADHETTDNNDQYNQNETATTSEPILVQTSFPTTLPQCKYGVACYRTDGSHFEQFLHPPSHRRHHTSNTSPSRVDSSNKINQHRANEQDMVPSNEISTMKTLPPCKYGLSCYRTNPNHFEHYSHPPGHIRQEQFSNIGDVDIPIVSNDSPSPMVPTCRPDNERKLKLKEKLKEQKKSELHFIELMQNKVESLIGQLELKDEEATKLRQDLTKMVTYSQELEMALAEEINHRERRELERKQIVAIPRQTPGYWGPNAFEEPYREIEISTQSPEFDIINQWMNATISNHGNKYGTINGQDPTEFLTNRITRIHNNELWHVYCYKKDMVIRKYNDRLTDCESSKYLQAHPILTPLLDTKTNEYWLFHGCSRNSLYHLLHSGYDPRVSNLSGMFGGGFYLAENSSKSNQYIPCPKCGKNSIGNDIGCNCANQQDIEFAIVLYRAALGDVHVAMKYDKEKYRRGPNKQRVRRPPKKANDEDLYDSVMGESMENGGDQLKYREFILYESGQAYPEYVIYFRRSANRARQSSNIENLKRKCRNFLINTFRKNPE